MLDRECNYLVSISILEQNTYSFFYSLSLIVSVLSVMVCTIKANKKHAVDGKQLHGINCGQFSLMYTYRYILD